MTGARDDGRPFRTWPAAVLLALIAGASCGAQAGAEVTQATPAPPQARAQTADAGAALGIPRILSPLDASRYAAIFALQEEASWAAADAEIAALQDKSLLGAVLAQRYLSPRYTTSFAEAREWLERYADLPDARAVWNLAKRRAPGKPVPAPVAASAQAEGPAEAAPAVRLPPEPRAIGLEVPGRFEAGINAFRAQHFAEAAQDFESVARAPSTASWYVAAAAFWAARSHLKLKQADQVDPWFKVAAGEPRTFYGLLARRMLGLQPDMKFGPQPLSQTEASRLGALPGGRRALALVQVGETDRAEAELKALSAHGNRNLADAIVALADLANMPALCIALNRQAASAARQQDALYPVPRWRPRDGFSVDRALLFALMLEESKFNADAQNGSGAAGLMQLMPATARSVARSAGIPIRSVADLVDPVTNLSLGQEYVKQLIGHEQVNGNLILLLAAYNSGPGLLAKWQNGHQQDDPLMFIESQPHQDTRLYVERVLTNMWIYRQRLGQDVPDLDALASNHWPTYVSMDSSTPGAAVHAASR